MGSKYLFETILFYKVFWKSSGVFADSVLLLLLLLYGIELVSQNQFKFKIKFASNIKILIKKKNLAKGQKVLYKCKMKHISEIYFSLFFFFLISRLIRRII